MLKIFFNPIFVIKIISFLGTKAIPQFLYQFIYNKNCILRIVIISNRTLFEITNNLESISSYYTVHYSVIVRSISIKLH